MEANMKKLFLDDERKPFDVQWISDVRYYELDWDIVRSYDQFVEYILEKGIPDFVSFDHDLADEHYQALEESEDHQYHATLEKTGYMCAKWLVAHCSDNKIKFPEFKVHSMNPIGKDNIIYYIKSAKEVLGI
jgi:hypothetical protein